RFHVSESVQRLSRLFLLHDAGMFDRGHGPPPSSEIYAASETNARVGKCLNRESVATEVGAPAVADSGVCCSTILNQHSFECRTTAGSDTSLAPNGWCSGCRVRCQRQQFGSSTIRRASRDSARAR